MPTLHFSFTGESKNAAPLKIQEKKFDISFAQSKSSTFKPKPAFSVEEFYNINAFAASVSEVFYLLAAEKSVVVDQFNVSIKGDLASQKNAANSIDISFNIDADATLPVIRHLLQDVIALHQQDAGNHQQVTYHYSLNALPLYLS